MAGSVVVFALTYQIKNPVADGKMKSDRLFAEVLLSLAYQDYVLLLGLPEKVLFLAKRGTNILSGIKTWIKKPTETNTGADAV